MRCIAIDCWCRAPDTREKGEKQLTKDIIECVLVFNFSHPQFTLHSTNKLIFCVKMIYCFVQNCVLINSSFVSLRAFLRFSEFAEWKLKSLPFPIQQQRRRIKRTSTEHQCGLWVWPVWRWSYFHWRIYGPYDSFELYEFHNFQELQNS